jgi:hypothetical protein
MPITILHHASDLELRPARYEFATPIEAAISLLRECTPNELQQLELFGLRQVKRDVSDRDRRHGVATMASREVINLDLDDEAIDLGGECGGA